MAGKSSSPLRTCLFHVYLIHSWQSRSSSPSRISTHAPPDRRLQYHGFTAEEGAYTVMLLTDRFAVRHKPPDAYTGPSVVQQFPFIILIPSRDLGILRLSTCYPQSSFFPLRAAASKVFSSCLFIEAQSVSRLNALNPASSRQIDSVSCRSVIFLDWRSKTPKICPLLTQSPPFENDLISLYWKKDTLRSLIPEKLKKQNLNLNVHGVES